MKNLLTILFFLISIAGISQPIVNRAGMANTVADYRLQATYNLFLPRYADTTAANVQKGIDSCGALIFTYDSMKVWYRQCSPKKWVLVGTGTGGGGSGTNIYNSDGSLTGNRTLTGGGFDLSFTGIENYSNIVNSTHIVGTNLSTNNISISEDLLTTITITTPKLIFTPLSNVSTQDRILGQVSSDGQVGYVSPGLGLILQNGVLKVDTASSALRDTFYVQNPLFRLNDSTIAIKIASTSDTGVITPAMKILWDAKIGGTTDNNLVVSGTDLNSNKSPLTLGTTGAVTWNRASGYVAKITATGDVTLSITNLQQGDFGYLVFYQDGTGGHTLTLPGAGLVVTNTGANDSTIYTFAYYGTDRWDWRNNLGVAGLTGVQGDMLYFSGTNTIANLNKSVGGFKVISNQGASNNPAYSTIDFSNILGQADVLTQLNITGTPSADVFLNGLGAWATPVATVPLYPNNIAYGGPDSLITFSDSLKFTPGNVATLEFLSRNAVADFYLRGSGDDVLLQNNDGSFIVYTGSGPTAGFQVDFNQKVLVNKSGASGASPFQVGGSGLFEGDLRLNRTASANVDLNLQNNTTTNVISSEGNEIIFWITGAARHFGWSTTAYYPYTNDAEALGTSSKRWADLFINLDIESDTATYKPVVYDSINHQLKRFTYWPVGAGGSGANTALSNLSAVAINAALLPGTDDAIALGSTAKQWSDLFVAAGAVINSNNGASTITMNADDITLAGATFKPIASTTSLSAMQFTAGTIPSSPASGQMDFDGTDLYFTHSTTARGRVAVWRVTVTNNASETMQPTFSDWVFSGTTATWTLPAISGNTGVKFFIKNRGSGNLTIQSNSGSQIYDVAAVASIIVLPGESRILLNDGTYFLVE